MPRYLLKIKAKDKRTGETKNFWCVFSTIVMDCISPIVQASTKEEAVERLKGFGFIGISELEEEAVSSGFLSERDVKLYDEIIAQMRSEPHKADELIKKYMDLIEKYSSALEKITQTLKAESYDDKYVEEISGELEDKKLKAWMEVYELVPPSEVGK